MFFVCLYDFFFFLLYFKKHLISLLSLSRSQGYLRMFLGPGSLRLHVLCVCRPLVAGLLRGPCRGWAEPAKMTQGACEKALGRVWWLAHEKGHVLHQSAGCSLICLPAGLVCGLGLWGVPGGSPWDGGLPREGVEGLWSIWESESVIHQWCSALAGMHKLAWCGHD